MSARVVRKVAIVGGLRTPFVKSFGQYKGVSNQEMLTFVVQNLVKKYKLEGKSLGLVCLGAVMKHASDWNLSREVTLSSGLAASTPGVTIQMACGTGLEAAAQVAARIALGQMEVGIAGGSDTNSDLPVSFSKDLAQILVDSGQARTLKERVLPWGRLRPDALKPQIPAVAEPRTGMSMGEHTEIMAKEWKIPRAEQDELAYLSHKNATEAYEKGFFNDLVLEFKGLTKDPLVRPDTTVEKLAKLKPAFDRTGNGTLTAGNSSPLTDGASAVLLCSEEYAQKNNLPVLAYLVDTQVSAIDFVGGEGLLLAPSIAVAQLLKRNNLKLQDLALYEIHEAFAAQVLCTLRAWENSDYARRHWNGEALGKLDRKKLNIHGSSLAMGHPFAATGGRILASLGKELQGKPGVQGLISICTAGGMGIASIVEGA